MLDFSAAYIINHSFLHARFVLHIYFFVVINFTFLSEIYSLLIHALHSPAFKKRNNEFILNPINHLIFHEKMSFFMKKDETCSSCKWAQSIYSKL